MDRQLINYLPPVLQNVREFKAIANTEQDEFASIWHEAGNRLSDAFIEDATDDGLKRWEKILRIVPKATDTMDVRRFRVLARFNEQLPYTYRRLEQQLEKLCGAGGYTIELDTVNDTLEVKIELLVKEQYDAVKHLLDRIIPANILVDLDLRYNQYFDFEHYTHEEMTMFTHKQLRDEVLS